MKTLQKWLSIIENEQTNALLPFLKGMTISERHQLLTEAETTIIAYLEIKNQITSDNTSIRRKATEVQRQMLDITIFCGISNKKHPLYKWLHINNLLQRPLLDQILPWHQPEWLSSYLNNCANNGSLPDNLTYSLLNYLLQQQVVKPSRLLVALLIPFTIFKPADSTHWEHNYTPEELEKYPDLLTRHIWYLFQYDTKIYQCTRFFKLTDYSIPPEELWFETFSRLEKNRKISRNKLLDHAMSALALPLTQRTISWMIRLLEYLKIQPAELLIRQATLFRLLSASRHSQTINQTLDWTLLLIKDVDFDVVQLLKVIRHPLQIKVKTVLRKSILLLDKIQELYPEKSRDICQLLVSSLPVQDIKIQRKSAKNLIKYGLKNFPEISQSLVYNNQRCYQQTLKILCPALPNCPKRVKRLPTFLPPRTKAESSPAPAINSLEQWVAAHQHFFKKPVVQQLDFFLDGIIRFQDELRSDKLKLLIPLFRQAFESAFGVTKDKSGLLGHLAAVFMVDLSALLCFQVPAHTQKLQKLIQSYYKQGYPINLQKGQFIIEKTHLINWYNPLDPSAGYFPIRELCLEILQRIQHKKQLPLLFCPSHLPCFLTPEVLINRILIFEKNHQLPHSLEIQIALSRLIVRYPEQKIPESFSLLSEKWKLLFRYLLIADVNIPGSIIEEWENKATKETTYWKAIWVSAISVKCTILHQPLPKQLPPPCPPSYLTGQHPWKVHWESRRNMIYDYKLQRMVFTGEPYMHTEIKIISPPFQISDSTMTILQGYFPGNGEDFRPAPDDLPYLLSLIPRQPEPVIALIIKDNLRLSKFWEQDSRKRVEATLHFLTLHWQPYFGETTHLLLASSLVCAHQPARLLAMNIWLEQTSASGINQELLGRLLGKLEKVEYGPLIRLTQLLEQHLKDLSPLQYQSLEILLTQMIQRMPAIPIRGTAQLLAIYNEVLRYNQSAITSPRIITILALWQWTAALKTEIRYLQQLIPEELIKKSESTRHK